MTGDGRNATNPYRVRVRGAWYWVDPTAAQNAIEPSDTVIVYPVSGDAVLAVLDSVPSSSSSGKTSPDGAFAFASLDGEHFTVAVRDIAAIHLAALDDEQ
jgi:hypothetical protein